MALLRNTILLLLLKAMILPSGLTAQKLPIKLGLKVSPDIGWVNPSTKDYKGKGVSGGIDVGLTSDFYFAEHYAVATGFSFLFLNGSLNMPYAEVPDTGNLDRKYKFSYLVIPVMLKMNTKEFGITSFYGQIGFETGFRLKANGKDDFHTENNGTVSEKKDVTDETTLMRFAAAIGAGAEIHLDENTSLFIGFLYSNGLHSVLKGNNTRYPDRESKGVINYAALNLGIIF